MNVYWIITAVIVILTRNCDVAATYECSNSESVACRQEIEDLRQDKSRYYYASDQQTLDEMCRKQIVAVQCVNSYAEECLSEKDQAYFRTLTLGSDKFFDTFCFEDTKLRKTYLQHSNCLRNISQKLDNCSQQYQISQKELDALENKELLEKTCCIYFENIRCSSNATLEACGKEAAQLVSELLILLSGTYLTARCQPYSKYEPESCTLVSESVDLLPDVKVWTMLIVFYTLRQRLR